MQRYKSAAGVACAVYALTLAGCGGGNGNSGSGAPASSTTSSSGASATQTLNAQGTIVLPNGAKGVAVVHIEDTSGNLMSTPSVANIAAAGSVTLVAEPADFLQGLIAAGQTLQTFNNATTSPQITDNVQLSSSAGTPLSLSVIADTSFSVVQMSQFADSVTTCFTGGLHLTKDSTGQPVSGTPGQPSAVAYVVSPDASAMVAWTAAGAFQFFSLSPVSGVHAENINSSFQLQGTGTTPSIKGRGALAWSPTSDTVLAGGHDGSLVAMSGLKGASPRSNAIYLPGTPAVASIAFAPSGKYAVVATASGLFTVSINSSGVAAVVSGPVNPSYTLSNGGTYQLAQAQSIAITADGKFLVALTDEPSATNGTLLGMPIDGSGAIGSVGMTQGGFLATQGVDDLFAH